MQITDTAAIIAHMLNSFMQITNSIVCNWVLFLAMSLDRWFAVDEWVVIDAGWLCYFAPHLLADACLQFRHHYVVLRRLEKSFN